MLATLFAAVLAVPPTAQPVEFGAAKAATVCEIRSAPEKFEGVSVTLRATYRSDRKHFSLLSDERCGSERNAIEVGRNNSASAARLWEAWEAACDQRGEGYCVVSEDVFVHGVVRRGEDGLFLDVCAMRLVVSAGQSQVRPNNSSKPTPLRGAA